MQNYLEVMFAKYLNWLLLKQCLWLLAAKLL